MTADFGAMVSRLLVHKRLDEPDLAAAAGVPESELRAVLAGGEPSARLLRGLAPVLGLHTSDLFLIAGQPVPDDLAPAGRARGVASLVWAVVYIPPVGRRVHELVLRAPRDTQARRTQPLEYERWFRPGFGALLVRLFGNRNMTILDAVMVLYSVTGFGPWSASTLGLVGRGGQEVSGELLAACSVVLGIPAGDLAALGAMAAPEPGRRTDPNADLAVELIWAARDLGAEQMARIDEQSHLIRHEYDDVVAENLRCHCTLFRRVPMSPTQH